MANFPFQRLQADLAALIADTPAGHRLISEPELAKQMGVSRATLREAMRTFETQGLIRRRQGAGTYVVGQSARARCRTRSAGEHRDHGAAFETAGDGQ